MTTAVGVLCARIRVEEKQIMTALGDAGAMGVPVSLTSLPLPPCPTPEDLLAWLTDPETGDRSGEFPSVIIDRSTNRQVARPVCRLLRYAGVQIIDAGLASTRNRQEVATAWGRAGVPRPQTLIGFSEPTAVQAASTLGYPVTLLPMIPSTQSTVLLDEDTAEAVIEHRVVLGTADEAVVLLQAGAPAGADIVRIHVVGGQAIAYEGEGMLDGADGLAVRAAQAIDAQIVSIDIASVGGTIVVWDAQPVADFRKSTTLGDVTMGEAISLLALEQQRISAASAREEVRHVLALSA